MSARVAIPRLSTGVPGLDEVLGGGLPELSFNLIAGGPGCGKTTLAHQILFANASPERPALYVTILGEPPLKMLRYQQQYTFFAPEKIPGSVRFLHLGQEVLDGGLDAVLQAIVGQVEALSPSLIVVDSFRSLVRAAGSTAAEDLQHFLQRLSLHLTSWQATTFLIGEYLAQEAENNPIFTIADGILWLYQEPIRSSVVRKLQVVKMRGQAPISGFHTVKISNAGLRVYPRLAKPPAATLPVGEPRRATGVAELDEMLGGGVPAAYSLLVVGPSGSGKSMLASQFIREGLRRGEAGVMAVFEKRPDNYLVSGARDPELAALQAQGRLRLLDLRPLDLSVDETMEEIRNAIEETGATRVVIDSLSGFELALAPAFRDDLRESLYRMVGALTGLGAAVMMTAELDDAYGGLPLSPHGISFLTDGILLQRRVELDGRLERVMLVAKMRGLAHSNALRLYDIDDTGIVVGRTLTDYQGLLTGAPRRVEPLRPDRPE